MEVDVVKVVGVVARVAPGREVAAAAAAAEQKTVTRTLVMVIVSN